MISETTVKQVFLGLPSSIDLVNQNNGGLHNPEQSYSSSNSSTKSLSAIKLSWYKGSLLSAGPLFLNLVKLASYLVPFLILKAYK
jgi:hypothetical protein